MLEIELFDHLSVYIYKICLQVIYLIYREKNSKNKVTQREEFGIKESQHFGSNEPSSGLKKDDIKWHDITDGFLMKYKTRAKLYTEKGVTIKSINQPLYLKIYHMAAKDNDVEQIE